MPSVYSINVTTTGSFTTDPNTTKTFNVQPLILNTSNIVPTTALFTQLPSKGTISLIKSGVVTLKVSGTTTGFDFVPSRNAIGTDTMKFKLQNGATQSAEITVTVTITKIPTVTDSLVQCNMNSSATQLDISEKNADTTTPNTSGTGYTIVIAVPPAISGATATVSKPHILYTPKPNWVGQDFLTYAVINPGGGSASGKLNINVVPLAPQLVSANVDKNGYALDSFVVSNNPTGTLIDLTPFIDGQKAGNTLVLTTIVTPPSTAPTKGTISASASELKVNFAPKNNATPGTDKFAVKIKNTVPSITGFPVVTSTVTLGVNLVLGGVAPVANSATATCKKNVAGSPTVLHTVAIPIPSLMNNKDYQVCVTSIPAHGSLSFDTITSVDNIIYIPTDGFTGASDSFTFVVRDTTNQISSPATVTITLT